MISESDRVTNQVRYRLIDCEGNTLGPFNSVKEAAAIAKQLWPDQEQRDFDNGKSGWDIEAYRDET